MADEAEKVPDKTEDETSSPADDNAEFDSSFDEFLNESNSDKSSDKPAAEPDDKEVIAQEKPEPKPESIGLSKADGEDEAPPADDMWAGATPKQKSAFDTAEKKWKSDKGRAAADATRIAALEQRINESTPAKPPAEPSDPLKAFESQEWQDTVAELPGLAAIKESVESVHAENQKLRAEHTETQKHISSFNDDCLDSQAVDQIKILHSEHPDWKSVSGDDLLAWATTQPSFIEQMFRRNADRMVDGAEVSHFYTLYKAANNIDPPESVPPIGQSPSPATNSNGGEPTKRVRDSQRRLQGNLHVPSAGPGTSSGAPETYEDAFDFYAAKGS